MGTVVASGSLGGVMVSEVVCTDLSGKEPHRQAGMGTVLTSGSLGGVMISTLAWSGRDVGSINALDTLFPMFITPMTLVVITRNLYKLCVCNCKY